MTSKYHHRRITPREFSALLRQGQMNMNDYLFISGRQQQQIEGWLGEDQRKSFHPTMADVILLELAAGDPGMVDVMIAIANRYSLGRPAQEHATVTRRK